MQNNLLINGKLVAGEGETVPVFNPATGEEILSIAEATSAQVDAAVEAADRAFISWSQTTPKFRAECLLSLADVITEHAQALNRSTAVSRCTAWSTMSYRRSPMSSASLPARPAVCRAWRRVSISKATPP